MESKNFEEAIKEDAWRKAMEEEIDALEKKHNPNWIYKVKHNPNGSFQNTKQDLLQRVIHNSSVLIMKKHLHAWHV